MNQIIPIIYLCWMATAPVSASASEKPLFTGTFSNSVDAVLGGVVTGVIEVLADGWRAPGSHLAVWNAHNRASGTYFYRFRFGAFTDTRKMVLLK